MSVDEVSTLATIVGAIAIIILFIIAVLFIRHTKKQESKDKSLMENITKKAKEGLLKENSDNNSTMWCEYCGTTNAHNDIKCQGCGAPLHRNIRK